MSMNFDFKKYAPVIFGGLVFLLVVFGWMQSCKATKLSIDYQLAEAQRSLSDALYRKELKLHKKNRAQWAKDIEHEKFVQAEKDKKIEQLEKDKVFISAQLIAEKNKTKSLTPNELVLSLSSRVGLHEVKLTGLLTYDFTRLGAENTWNIFLDERGNYSLLQKEKGTTTEQKEKIVSLTTEKQDVEKQRDTLQTDLTNCDKAKTDTEKAKDAAVKANKSQRWKGRKEGTIFTSVVLVVIKLAGWVK